MTRRLLTTAFSVLPADAGMSPLIWRAGSPKRGAPRGRGDEPKDEIAAKQRA